MLKKNFIFFREAVDAANLNLAVFEEKRADPDVEKMLKSLENECAGPKTLSERLADN